MGEVGDHLESASSDDVVEQLVYQRGDEALESADHLGCKRLLRKPSQPGVVRRIEEEEARLPEGTRIASLGVLALGGGGLQSIDGRRRMTQDVTAILE